MKILPSRKTFKMGASPVLLVALLSLTYPLLAAPIPSQPLAPETPPDPVVIPVTPDAPLAPSFSEITDTSVLVTAPALPERTQTLTLLRVQDGVDVVVAKNLSGTEETYVDELTASTLYTFRYLAVNSEGNTMGEIATITTADPPPAPVPAA